MYWFGAGVRRVGRWAVIWIFSFLGSHMYGPQLKDIPGYCQRPSSYVCSTLGRSPSDWWMTDSATTEIAVRRSFLLERKESRRKAPPGLGFSQVNYGNLFHRDKWTLFSIAVELGCSVEDLLSPEDKKTLGPRWSELVQASEDILSAVRTLPLSLRHLVLLRAQGDSWRKIQRKNSGRIMFSMREDFDRAMDIILRRAPDQVIFLASCDNFFVVRPRG